MARVEFRDGPRDVPDHVADLMRGLDTYALTFEQARDLANNKILRDRLNAEADRVVRNHFTEHRIT